MKTQLLLISLLGIAANYAEAQNTSYYPDNQSIGGNWNVAVGDQALSSPGLTGQQNTASGFLSMLNTTTGDGNTASGLQSLFTNVSGSSNIAIGQKALFYNVSGNANVAVGTQALHNTLVGDNVGVGSHALWSNTNGTGNLACGNYCLFNNASGWDNVGLGYSALNANINGWDNVAVGSAALQSNTTFGISGAMNVGVGSRALRFNTVGQRNTAIGTEAQLLNIDGLDNVATGYRSLYANQNGNKNCAYGNYALFNNKGDDNTAIGIWSLYNNQYGLQNTASGFQCMFNTTSGSFNVASGIDALFGNTSGSRNSAFGGAAMQGNDQGEYNAAVGFASLISNVGNGAGNNGSRNSALGAWANVNNGNYEWATAIGANSIVNASNRVYIGTAGEDVWCFQGLWNTSDQRFKTNVKEDDVKGLEFIQLLRPVVYNFDTKKLTEHMTKSLPDSIRKEYLNRDFDTKTKVRMSGFLAQEVEAAAKKADYDFNGVHAAESDEDTYGLSYAMFVVPLVKAVQEQQVIIETDKAEHQQQMLDLQRQIEDLKQELAKTVAGGIGQTNPGAGGFLMEQNEPNPFSNETVVKYALPQTTGSATLYIYDLTGKQITSYPITDKGSSSVTLTSKDLAAGIYIYTLVADGKVMDSKRMIVSEK